MVPENNLSPLDSGMEIKSTQTKLRQVNFLRKPTLGIGVCVCAVLVGDQGQIHFDNYLFVFTLFKKTRVHGLVSACMVASGA